MSDDGRAGQDRGTSGDLPAAAEVLHATAMSAVVLAEALTRRLARGQPVERAGVDAILRASEELDDDVRAFIRDTSIDPDQDVVRETVDVVNRVGASIVVIRRTLDLLIDHRDAERFDNGGAEAAGLERDPRDEPDRSAPMAH